MSRSNSPHSPCVPVRPFLQGSLTGVPSAWWRAGLYRGVIVTHSGRVQGFLENGNRTLICLQTGLPSPLPQQMAVRCPEVERLHTSQTEYSPPSKAAYPLGNIFLNIQTLQVFSGFYKCQHPVGIIVGNLSMGLTCTCICGILKIHGSHK